MNLVVDFVPQVDLERIYRCSGCPERSWVVVDCASVEKSVQMMFSFVDSR